MGINNACCYQVYIIWFMELMCNNIERNLPDEGKN